MRMPWKEVGESVEWLRFLYTNPLPVSIRTHESALKIAERYGFQIYGALLVASALAAGCDVLYSENLQDGQVIAGSLTVGIRLPNQ